MRLAYVTNYDPANVNDWSGIPYYLRGGLREAFEDVKSIGPLLKLKSPVNRVRRVWYTHFGETYMHEQRAANCRYLAAQVAPQIEDVDAVLCLGWRPLSYLETDKPLFCYIDATSRKLLAEYGEPFAKVTQREWIDSEDKAFARCTGVFVSSKWCADSVINEYGVPKSKVRVVPMGANFEPPEGETYTRPTDSCRLLFLGKDWERKGGQIAIDTVQELRRRDVPAELFAAGCKVPGFPDVPPHVHAVGFIDKSTPAGRLEFARLFGESHFFVLPVSAEAFGIVFAEASAFGLPSITSDVGGIASAVTNGLNGYRIKERKPKAYADVIERLWNSPDEYASLRETSKLAHASVLNWNAAATSIRKHMAAMSAK